MKRFRLKVGIDVDDVLFSCDQYAIDMANAKWHYDPPLSIEELDTWGLSGKRTDVIFELFKEKEFFETQPVIKGAQEFIRKLSEIAEVYFITAIAPEYMSIRARKLIKAFPEIPKENIIMGFQKSMIQVDIILDDAPHNVLTSNSPYPVLMRKPWNQSVSGCLSVNNYSEFLTLVETVSKGYSQQTSVDGHKVYVLIGPSGSGKTELIKAITRNNIAARHISYTTRQPRFDETEADYHFITKEQFHLIKSEMFETTCYAGEYYGSSKADLDLALKDNDVIMALDICGAIAIKHFYDERAVLIYVRRPKKELITAVLKRSVPDQDKVNRIVSLDDEFKNEELCDAVIDNCGLLEEAIASLESIIKNC